MNEWVDGWVDEWKGEWVKEKTNCGGGGRSEWIK